MKIHSFDDKRKCEEYLLGSPGVNYQKDILNVDV